MTSEKAAGEEMRRRHVLPDWSEKVEEPLNQPPHGSGASLTGAA